MDQLALAMKNIKQAGAQNMTGAKQAEVAALNLHELGLKQKQRVGWYKIYRLWATAYQQNTG